MLVASGSRTMMLTFVPTAPVDWRVPARDYSRNRIYGWTVCRQRPLLCEDWPRLLRLAPTRKRELDEKACCKHRNRKRCIVGFICDGSRADKADRCTGTWRFRGQF